jgi:hypothetical protein
MKHKPAMYALERLHAELGGQILQNKQEAPRLAKCMKHVEAVLKMLQPGYSVRAIAVRRRKANPWFRRGTIYRHALDVLRAAQGPLTAREIAEAMPAKQGATGVSGKRVIDLGGSVLSSLRKHKDRGVVVVGEGVPARWKLIS